MTVYHRVGEVVQGWDGMGAERIEWKTDAGQKKSQDRPVFNRSI